MFRLGEHIIYSNSGVCRVEAIGAPAGLRTADAGKVYYTLVPVYGTGVIYIPVDSGVYMRPVLTRGQAEALLREIPDISSPPCLLRDPRALAEHYRGMMHTHCCEQLVQMLKTIGQKWAAQRRRGKPLGKVDQQFLHTGLDALCGELAVALGQTTDEVRLVVQRELEMPLAAK